MNAITYRKSVAWGKSLGSLLFVLACLFLLYAAFLWILPLFASFLYHISYNRDSVLWRIFGCQLTQGAEIRHEAAHLRSTFHFGRYADRILGGDYKHQLQRPFHSKVAASEIARADFSFEEQGDLDCEYVLFVDRFRNSVCHEAPAKADQP